MKKNNKNLVYYQLTYPKIIETLRLVAAPPEVQVTLYDDNLYPPDEIVEAFDHAFLMLNVLAKSSYITENQYNCVKDIDNFFETFSEKDWTKEAMYQSELWKNIRNAANVALSEFGLEYSRPNLYWFF